MLSILGLVPRPPGEMRGEQALFNGEDLLRMSKEELHRERPQLIIADEPTTALDVTIQAQIIGLVQRVLVMYPGCIIEEAPVDCLFRDPQHPILGLDDLGWAQVIRTYPNQAIFPALTMVAFNFLDDEGN
jgi:ABC-type microcin C transport system duplicated ATPase subunit YejF